MKKKKWFEEINLASVLKAVLICLTVIGGYGHYTATRLNDFIMQMEEQNIDLRHVVSSLTRKISKQQNEILALKKNCKVDYYD